MAGIAGYYGRYNFHYLAVTAHSNGQRELLIMSSLASFPDGRLSFPADPVKIPDIGKVALRMRVHDSRLQFSYAMEGDGEFKPVGPTLDASILSDECGGHGEHGSFTGAFVAIAAHDLNGTAMPADFSYLSYEPERD